MSPPVLYFDSYLKNEENIEKQDIVAWVTIGKEHLPRTEDMPLVTNFGVGFSLLPWNVFAVNGASQEFATSAFPPEDADGATANADRRIEGQD